MITITVLNNPARLAGWPHNGLPVQRQIGQLSVAQPAGRQNLLKITTGVAMAGGGVFALLNVPGTKKVNQIALGTLGGALLLTGLLNVYDGVA